MGALLGKSAGPSLISRALTALNFAESQGLIRNYALTYPPGKPSLAADVSGQLTDVKLGGNRISARAALLAVDAVVQEADGAEYKTPTAK